MDHLEQFAALRQCYEDYLEDNLQRVQDEGGLRGLTRLLTGPSPVERRAVEQFFRRLQEVVAALDPEDGLLSARAAEYMLITAQGHNDESRLAVQAAEGLALTLIPRLDRDTAGRILSAYTARYPKRRLLLPKQREVLAALEQAAQ